MVMAGGSSYGGECGLTAVDGRRLWRTRDEVSEVGGMTAHCYPAERGVGLAVVEVKGGAVHGVRRRLVDAEAWTP
jgi:hypothetical protein